MQLAAVLKGCSPDDFVNNVDMPFIKCPQVENFARKLSCMAK